MPSAPTARLSTPVHSCMLRARFPSTAGLSVDNVVKTTVFLADMGDFAAMNEVYGKVFTEPYPARSAVAVRELPKGVLVEVEVIAVR